RFRSPRGRIQLRLPYLPAGHRAVLSVHSRDDAFESLRISLENRPSRRGRGVYGRLEAGGRNRRQTRGGRITGDRPISSLLPVRLCERLGLRSMFRLRLDRDAGGLSLRWFFGRDPFQGSLGLGDFGLQFMRTSRTIELAHHLIVVYTYLIQLEE